MSVKNIINKLKIFLTRLWRVFTEPFATLPQAGDDRRASTTAGFLLVGIISVGVEQILAGNTPRAALVLMIIGYILARTRWFRIAAFILLITLSFPSYLVALRLPNPNPSKIDSAFVWVVIPLLLSSLIYSVRTTVVFSAINFLALALLPFIRPELTYYNIGGALGFYGLASTILIIVMVQRNEIEKDRQKELIESQSQLEQEVSERERFSEQAQKRADQLAMLNEVSSAISNLQDLDNTLNAIFEEINRSFTLDIFFVALYNEKTDLLTFPIMFDNGKRWQEQPKTLGTASRIAGVIQAGKPLLWNRSLDEISESANASNRVGDSSRVAASILMSPLQIGQKTIGAISVQSYRMNAFSENDLSLLSGIANHVTIAIQNSRYLDEINRNARHLMIINETGKALSALNDLPTLLEIVYQQIRQSLQADTFFVGIYDDKNNEVTYPVMYDDGIRYASKPERVNAESYLYKLLHGEKAQLINRTREELSVIPTISGMIGNTTKLSASLLVVPLTLGEKVIGVISVQSYVFNAYSEYDLNLLVQIANQVSIAIENSRLYSAAQEEITERLKVEEQLRSTEARFRELVEQVPAVIYSCETGATGRWFYVSPQIESLLGFTPEEWLSDPDLWYQQIHPDDREYAVTTEAKLLIEGSRLETEYRVYTKDRRLLWIHDESTNVTISDNQQFIVQGILTDVTVRKQAELTLKENEERYHTLFITAERQARELRLLSEVQSAIARELDLSVLIHTVVEVIAKTFGYVFVSLYKLEGGFLQLQHEVGYESVIEQISISEGVSGKVINTGLPVLVQDVNHEPDFLRASPHVRSEICVPLFDGDKIFGTLNVESSQEYRLTEDDLRLMNALSEQVNIAIRRAGLYTERAESLRREQHINEFAHTINSTLDLPAILETVTRLCVELIGADTGTVNLMSDDGMVMNNTYSFNEAPNLNEVIPKGQGLTWLTYEKGRPIILDEYSEHINALPEWSASGIHAYMGVPIMVGEKRFGTIALYNRTSDKKFTQRDLAMVEAITQEVAIAIQNARLFDALQKELTEHKSTQDQLQILVNELEAKNAELERFTYSVSHDLKSPLVTIGGFLGFLEADIQKGEVQRIENTINRIRDAAKKMQRLLDELLELSRIGRLINPPSEVPFGELVREALELAHGQLTEKQVQVRVEAELPNVNVDRIRMVEVLQNLIVNAVKFMGAQENPIITIGMQIQHEQKVFFVKDNGIGIAPAYHQKIFGLFDKLDGASDGTGIGLALVKRIIEVHGGTIWVESETGKGATFFFTLEHKKQQENL